MARTGVGIWSVPGTEGLVQLGELLLPIHPADKQPPPWAEEHRRGLNNWGPSFILSVLSGKAISVCVLRHRADQGPCESTLCHGSCFCIWTETRASVPQNKHRAEPAGQGRALAEAGAPAPCCQQSHHFPAVPNSTVWLWMWRD